LNNKNTGEKSIILSGLDRMASKIYGLLSTGIFGRFFTSYSPDTGNIAKRITGKRKFFSKVDSVRRSVAKNIESSIVFGLYTSIVRYLLSVKLRVYGTAMVTFFMYAAAIGLFGYFTGDASGIPVDFVLYILLGAAAVPLTTSKSSLYNVLRRSPIGKGILSFTGNREDGYEPKAPCGRSNFAFLIGMVFGLATFVVPASSILELVFRMVWMLAVIHSPEFGIVSICFLMPFDSTMVLVAEIAVIIVSFVFKLILGKRTVKLEAVDIAALMFALMMLVGGVFSISSASMKPMLVYLCFMSVYFLIVSLMRSGEWLKRCVLATVSAGAIVAVYGVFQYMTGMIGYSTQWLDSEMFEDISGRAISTLENPNVLGEYLVMIIPMAAVMFLFRYTDVHRRFAAFAVFGCMCACLVVTWSRGAWLGMIFAAIIFCFIWSSRTLHMIWPMLLAIPFLPTILPDNIMSRITSIGNLADSSTAYRFNIWLGTIKMLPDRILSGIGIGNDAWNMVYPDYALPGMDAAQHSHSLFFQIWVELGLVALVIFLVFIVMLFMSNFSMYKKVSLTGDSLIKRICIAPLKDMYDETAVRSTDNSEKQVKRARCIMRMNAAAPLCGIAGVLLQGFTDNIWYNYRVYLMFWICLGLCAAYASFGRERVSSGEMVLGHADKNSAVADISLSQTGKKISCSSKEISKGKDMDE